MSIRDYWNAWGAHIERVGQEQRERGRNRPPRSWPRSKHWLALIGAILLALGGTRTVARFQNLPLAMAWDVLALSVALSIALGILFGIYPAWKAAHVDPIAALRAQ